MEIQGGVPVRESRKRSKACADDEIPAGRGDITTTDCAAAQPLKDSDQVSTCSTMSPRGTAAGSTSPNETPPADTPEPASDSCGSHPSNSPVNAEDSAKPNSDNAVAAATKQKAASRDDVKLVSLLRASKGGEQQGQLLPPLLPSPASPAPRAEGEPAAAAQQGSGDRVCTKETKDKDRVGGLDWGERRRKKMMDKAYQGFEGFPRAQQVARLKQSVERLQGALPGDAKTTLRDHIRRYLVGEVTPEELAEGIKQLVDQHGVVVPLQEHPATPSHPPHLDQAPARSVSPRSSPLHPWLIGAAWQRC